MIQVLGSFATVWMLLWLALTLTLIVAYPLIRKPLFTLRSAYAGNLLLGLIAIPMLFSLISAALLFIPAVETVLVRDHCHNNCGQHLPLLGSVYLAWPGFIFLGAFILYFGWKLGQQLRFASKLNTQLRTFSDSHVKNGYFLLDAIQPLVFTVGWWRNTIYISEGIRTACNEQEIAIVLTHEDAHIERKDNLRIMAARLLTLLLPKTLAGKLLDDLQLLIESACDAKAAERFGALNVAAIFVKLQRLMPTIDPLPYGVSAINGSPIEQRVQALLESNRHYQPSTSVTLTGFSCLLVGLVLIVDPLHHVIESLLHLL